MNKSAFFIVGKHPVIEALKNPKRKVIRVFLTEESKKTIHRESPNKNLLENIIEKGYVAIDGTSLTVNKIYDKTFQVSIIPHTLKETTFKNLKINQYVNVETDVNARYIKKYVEDIIKRKSL